MKDKFIKVCPRCGSTNIIAEGDAYMSVWDACNDCGLHRHSSIPSPNKNHVPILEVKESELENFRKHIKKNPIVQD